MFVSERAHESLPSGPRTNPACLAEYAGSRLRTRARHDIDVETTYPYDFSGLRRILHEGFDEGQDEQAAIAEVSLQRRLRTRASASRSRVSTTKHTFAFFQTAKRVSSISRPFLSWASKRRYFASLFAAAPCLDPSESKV